jgi:hypothetical protein
MATSFRRFLFTAFPVLFTVAAAFSQSPAEVTQLKVEQLISKMAEYHHLTEGTQVGYRIKIHFGMDKEEAQGTRTYFSTSFADYPTYLEYQQPNWVVLIGDYKTKREAFEFLQKIKSEFPNAFIVKGKIKCI